MILKKNEVPSSPKLGVEWTQSLENDIIDRLAEVDCVEIIPENFFFNRRDDFIKKLGASGTPVMIHGVELSIGSDEPVKQAHLERMLEVADRVNMIDLSDHLCMTESGGVEVGQLTPLPWSVNAADVVCKNIERVMAQVRVPFLIENIANRFVFPETELTEVQFINRVLDRTGCQLLLDLHNLHANAFNFKFDPFAWLEELDLNRVGAIHLAGGHYDDEGTLVDGHSHPIPDRVWELYRSVCAKVTPACTIVERTENFPVYGEVLTEVDKARGIVNSSIISFSQDLQSGVGR